MSQRSLKLGLCLPLVEDPQSGRVPRWDEIRASAAAAEQMGLDTVWIPDELLWRNPQWPGPRGWWECVAIAGAVAACTSRISVGTWVMANLYRNPTLTAKIVETLDEIAGGRFVFGIGSGSGDSEAEAFGYPRDHVYTRFEEALEILLPLLKTGRVEHRGTYYQATDLELRPRGPRPGGIPLMIGAHGPKMIRLAARHADVWSGFATEGSHAAGFVPLLDEVTRACDEVGRDPASIGRSVGVFVEPTEATGAAASGVGEPIRGSAQKIAEAIAEFAAAGVTQVEMWPWPFSLNTVEALAPIVAALDQA
ncbi:MAG TPA: LLM class flavin-dependent oxidoreductase [Candidatus Dormibacteraeota bacterium]|nr:LLM class flavin-dependent oxidoreductase [Candidatus Dormibacteraeota bacterium]